MNIKKIVSAASALAIAVSAFAGLAVTASAAVDKSWDFTKFTDDEYVAYSSTDTATVGSISCNLGTGTYDGLAFQGADKWFIHNGGLYNGNGGPRSVGVLNLTEGQIVTVDATTAPTLTTTGTASLTSTDGTKYKYTMTADGTFGFSLTRYYVINSITVETLEVSADAHNITTEETDSATVSTSVMKADEGTEITVTPTAKTGYEAPFTISVVDAEGNAVEVSDNKFTMPASDVTVSATATARTAATKLTVNYQDSLKEADVIELSGLYVGDSYTYYVPAYIENSDKLYKATNLGTTKAGTGSTSPYVTDFSQTVELTGEETEITAPVTYEAVEADTYQYIDYNDTDTDNGISRMWMYSSGKYKNLDTTDAVDVLTVAESGIYTVTVNTGLYYNSTSYGSTITVLAAGEEIASSSNYNTSYTPVVENVTLSAGDTIAVQGSSTGVSVDYVLIEKTGDITEPEPETPAFAIDLGEAIEANGTGDYAEDVATAYIATVTNSGAEGTTSLLSVTAKDKTVSQEVKLTLEKDANVYIGMILNNVGGSDTVTAAIE